MFLDNIEPVAEDGPLSNVASSSSSSGDKFSSFSNEELQTKLQEALAEEAYEKAAKIRDELNKRKSS